MTSLLGELTNTFSQTFSDLGFEPKFGTVTVSQRPELCQFQCNGAMGAAKKAGKNPREVADAVVKSLESDDRFETLEVAGPGFVNITLTNDYLTKKLNAFKDAKNFGAYEKREGKIIIDFGAPNVAKSLHVGHLRSALIGESLKKTYRFAGQECIGDIHLGDWGLPMGQLIAIIEKKMGDLPYFDNTATEFPSESPVTIEDLEVLYPEASTLCKEDEEFAELARLATYQLQEGHPGYTALWQHMRNISVDDLKKTYDTLGVEFDLWYGESSVANRIGELTERMKSSGAAVESDGALIIEVETEDDKQTVPPLMYLNSRGASTYATTDLATIDERIQVQGATKMVYIVDNRQSLHFEQVFRAARKANLVSPEVELKHAANGTVNGPNGKPLKTREGNLPRLADLISESGTLALAQLDEGNLAADFEQTEREQLAKLVGIAALAYGELQNHRTTDYNFDLERFTQLKGQTGPYIQYVAVRASSILAKTAAAGLSSGDFIPPQNDSERTLILDLLRLPEIVGRTLDSYAPNQLAEYAYELSSSFNSFYDICHILNESNEAQQESWISLVELTRNVLTALADLLCIPIPERM